MGRRRLVVAIVAVVLVGMQLVPVARTNPAISQDVPGPADVKVLLRRACYDCHSNETVWPWYARVAPVSWRVAHDVEEGRDELNFSTWDAYGAAKKRKKLREVAEQLEAHAMPPWDYRLMHRAARLDGAARERLQAWAAAEIAALGP